MACQLAGVSLSYHRELVISVRKRVGFVPVFQQGFVYGTGDRQLAYRYERVAAAWRISSTRRGVAQSSPVDQRLASVERRIARAWTVAGKLLRARHRADFGDRTFRIGNALGRRFGQVDQAMSQVDPPEPRFWGSWEHAHS